MAYDALAESISLIATRTLRPVPRLSRRRRFAAMAVDVAGDVAATMFLRRGAGCVHEETWVLVWRGGQWRMLGGGGSSHDYDDDLLGDRPDVIPEAMRTPWCTLAGIDPQLMVAGDGMGGVRDDGGGTSHALPPGRWISYTTMLASAQIGWVRVEGRDIAVPWHGQALVTWVGHRFPEISALDVNGRCRGTARAREPRRSPHRPL